jgi:hypothetical protein
MEKGKYQTVIVKGMERNLIKYLQFLKHFFRFAIIYVVDKLLTVHP